MTDVDTSFITDAEKGFAFLAQMLSVLDDIKDGITETAYPIDMYGDDPGGLYGVIADPFKPGASAPIYKTFNGPYTIQSIVASWGSFPAAAEFSGKQAAPVANTVIIGTNTLPVGLYNVQWSVGLAGTLTVGTDDNNFQLRANAGAFAVNSANPAVVGEFPQDSIQIFLTTPGTIVIRNNANATAGSEYDAQISVSPVNSATLQLKDRTLQLPTQAQIVNLQQLSIPMDRDDQVVLTVSPAAPCHLEIMGVAGLRKRDKTR